MKNSLYLYSLAVLIFSVAGCATSSDLKTVRSELNQQMEEKVVAVDTRIAAAAKRAGEKYRSSGVHAQRAGQYQRRYYRFARSDPTIARSSGNIEKGDFPGYQKKTTRKIDNLLLRSILLKTFWKSAKKIQQATVDSSASAKDPQANRTKRQYIRPLIRSSKKAITIKPEKLSKFPSRLSQQRIFR